MISENIFLVIGYYFKCTNTILHLGLFDFNLETKSFQCAPAFARIHLGFSRILAIGFILLLGVFLLLKGSNSDSQEFTNFTSALAFDMVGYAEVASCVLANFTCGWLNRNIREFSYALNQLHVHMKNTILALERSSMATDPSIFKRQQKSAIMFYILIFLFNFFPIGYMGAVVVILEPVHQLIKYILEEDITPSIRHLPIFFVLLNGLMCICLIIFYSISAAFLYTSLSTSTVEFMTPIAVYEKTWKRKFNGKVLIEYRFETKKFGIVGEESLIKYYRTEQVLNSLLNQIYSSLAISVVCVIMLVVFVCLCFMLITSWKVFLQLPLIAIAIIMVGFVAPIAVEYLQAECIGELVVSFSQFTVKSKQLCGFNSLYGKFSKSCRKSVVLELAYPFFAVTKQTFPQFLMQGIDLLITLLSIYR